MASDQFTACKEYSNLQPNCEAQKRADAVRGDVERAVGKKFDMYTAILYKTQQAVTGTNYLISVQTGPETSCHMVVHEHPDEEVHLGAFQVDLKLYAPLEPIGINTLQLPAIK